MAHTFDPRPWVLIFLSPVLGRYTSLNPALWWWRQYYKAGRDRILAHSVWGFIETRAQPLHSGDWVEVRSLSGGWMFYFSQLISDSQFLLRPITTLATLLFYHSRSQIILRKCFFQMTALLLWDPSEMDLTSETEWARVNIWRKWSCDSPDWICHTKGKKNLLSSDLHVAGGARSWATEAKTSGFPFLIKASFEDRLTECEHLEFVTEMKLMHGPNYAKSSVHVWCIGQGSVE